jgi:hypothetical protein
MTDSDPTSPVHIRRLQDAVGPAFALLAGMQLGIFTEFAEEALTAEVVAARLGLPASRLERLLRALTVAGLLETDGTAFRNTAEARCFLVAGKPGYIGGEHELLADLWHADLTTATSIRENRPAATHDYQAASAEASAAFFRRLADGARSFGRELAEHRLRGDERVLDIGGGPGHVLAGMLDVHPKLHATLFELPQTLAVAQILLADLPQRDAIHFEAGDIGTAGSAQTHDVVLMKALLQCLAPAEARRAVTHAFASLDPGGRIFIAGVGILEEGGLSPASAVFYDLTFMNLYQGGASYTRGTYADWLQAAGFEAIEFDTLPSGSLVITARRPQ